LLLAFPPLYIVGILALHGTRLEYLDYWGMLREIFDPTGRFLPLGLLVRSNEHLVVLPKVLMALNVLLFGGSNAAHCVVVFMIALATFVMLCRITVKHYPGEKAEIIILTAAFSFSIFTPHGLHNFAFAMSGGNWFLANLFAVAAIS
jgi:hypothetical protein